MVLAFVAMLPSTPLYLRLVIVAVVCLSGVHAALLGVSVGAFVMCVTRRPHLAEIGAACLLLPGGIILMRHLTPSACGHADIWSMALEMVYRSPFTGSGQFAAYWRASRPECPPYLHAHSLPLQVAAEHGLIGLLALALDVIVAAWMLLQRRSTSAPYWPALLALAAMSLVDVPEVRGYVCLFGLITFALALL
jgi:O-antigen ligase